MIFDRAIPPFAESNIEPAVAEILARSGLAPVGYRPLRLPSGRREGDRGAGSAHCRSARARSTTSATCWPITATCRRRRRCSCSNARCAAGLPTATLLTAMGPGFTASCVSLKTRGMTPARSLLLALRHAGAAGRAWLAPAQHGRAARDGRAWRSRRGHYPLIVAAARRLARRALAPRPRTSRSIRSGSAVFVALQVLRLWVLATLGRRWTTRIIVVPGERAGRARALPLRARIPTTSSSSARSRCCRFASACPGTRWSSRSRTALVLAIRIRAENAALASESAMSRT